MSVLNKDYSLPSYICLLLAKFKELKNRGRQLFDKKTWE